MRQIYHNEIILTEPATPGHYLYDNPVDPGKILAIKNLSVYWDGFKTSETGQFFIQDGGRKIFLGDDVPDRTSGHAYWSGQASLGEGDQPAVYCPDSEADDQIHFFVSGELWDLNYWRQG